MCFESNLYFNSNVIAAQLGKIKYILVISFLNGDVCFYKLKNIILNDINKYNFNTDKQLEAIIYKDCSSHIAKVIKFINNDEKCILIENNNMIKCVHINENEIIQLNMDFKNKFIDNSKIFIPQTIISWYNKIRGIVEINENFLLAYTDYNLIPIILNERIPECSRIKRELDSRNKAKSKEFYLRNFHDNLLQNLNDFNLSKISKSNSIELKENNNFSIITKFISNIFIEYFDEWLFVIEINWEYILGKMVNPIIKTRYKK